MCISCFLFYSIFLFFLSLRFLSSLQLQTILYHFIFHFSISRMPLFSSHYYSPTFHFTISISFPFNTFPFTFIAFSMYLLNSIDAPTCFNGKYLLAHLFYTFIYIYFTFFLNLLHGPFRCLNPPSLLYSSFLPPYFTLKILSSLQLQTNPQAFPILAYILIILTY